MPTEATGAHRRIPVVALCASNTEANLMSNFCIPREDVEAPASRPVSEDFPEGYWLGLGTSALLWAILAVGTALIAG